MDGIKRALISVSNKTGVEEFACALIDLGVEIVSTGGTASALAASGVPVRTVEDLTGFPEMLDGRVKTLHPAVHGALLARRDLPAHMRTVAERGIGLIDLLCVNLYPFAETISRPDATLAEAIENIDIGGPAMIRSAAKNHESVTVLVDPRDYDAVIEEIRTGHGATTRETRRRLAARAYVHTACYDAMIASYLAPRFAPEEPFPPQLAAGFDKVQDCRYGENPHQRAAFYREPNLSEPCIASAKQLHGKELSFNNIYDLDAALEVVKEFDELPAAVIIKHANPCGVAVASSLAEAVLRARDSDPTSAFGGILALNRVVDAGAAEQITAKNTFLEAIIAPGYEPEAMSLLTGRKGWGADLRLLEVEHLSGWRDLVAGYTHKRVVGGLLVQDRDVHDIAAGSLTPVTNRAPNAGEVADLQFAWRVVKHVRSNAIVLSRSGQTVGVGAGQMNRVRSVRLALEQAGDRARGSVMASDAFFPFPDGPEAAAEAGITAIIQPGGSKKDSETIEVCNSHGIAMLFTGVRHFLH